MNKISSEVKKGTIKLFSLYGEPLELQRDNIREFRNEERKDILLRLILEEYVEDQCILRATGK